MTSTRAIRVALLLFVAVGLMMATKKAGSQACCPVPTTETSAVVGPLPTTDGLTQTRFKQAISDSAGTSFDGRTVTESRGNSANVDNCNWAGAPFDPASLSGGSWVVAGGQVQGQHNTWGWDLVGWPVSKVDTIRQDGPAHGIQLPCVSTVYQNLSIECNASLFVEYIQDNVLTATVDVDHVTNCRRGACNQINYAGP